MKKRETIGAFRLVGIHRFSTTLIGTSVVIISVVVSIMPPEMRTAFVLMQVTGKSGFRVQRPFRGLERYQLAFVFTVMRFPYRQYRPITMM